MPTLTIDGQSVEFAPGESIIVAATRKNIEIPYYCWHPRLSVAANCRMCLVEIEKAPKLVPACQTECKEGMVVHTDTAKVKEVQRAVHEFLLINHPIDCPICDQAGECKLQDYYMKFDSTPSRMHEAKTRKPRLERLGPYVVYNAERCILCTRCVRFMDEVAGERQLGIFQRGDHAEIGVFPGQELDSAYSLNTVDVCPVGALTSTVFRFKQRAWNLRRSPSLCGGCARGCNIHVDARSGVVYRFLPRENDAVNRSWLCDEGRLSFGRANEGRLTRARAKVGSAVEAVEAEYAKRRALELLTPVAQARTGLAAAISLHATCEEAYVFGRLATEVLGAETIAVVGHPPGAADELLRVADKNPNRAGVMRVLADLGVEPASGPELTQRVASGKVKALLAVGHESGEAAALARAAGRLEVFIHVAHAQSPLTEVAQVTLPGLSFVQVDGTWINIDSRAQRLVPAFAPEEDARPNHEWLLELAAGLGVSFALPSVPTIRGEMERRLPSFKDARLAAIGPTGHRLDGTA